MEGEYLSLPQYLENLFRQRDLVMSYSLSSGLQFATPGMEVLFRDRYLKENKPDTPAKSATEEAARSHQQNQAAKAPLSKLIGETPSQVLKVLERVFTDESEGAPRCALVINFANNVVPSQAAGQNNIAERINAEMLESFSRSQKIKNGGHIIALLTPTLAGLNGRLRSSQSDIVAIKIPKPDESSRIARWNHIFGLNGIKIEQNLTAEFLGRVTNGLSLKQIDSICAIAKQEEAPVTMSLVKNKKQEILETEFGDRVKIKHPRFGFDHFGGKDELKQHMLEIRNNILRNCLRRAPMGILACGPPGTGKTFFFECFAYECNFNVVEIGNLRSKWVGESEENAERLFAALDDLSPVIVIEDEADQSETSRDAPSGDTGVSNRLRQMKFMFTSDPARRGKVIWVRISNRSDLLDEAYKREGRSDDTIPFLMPEPEEYADIIKVMFKRYGIPTDIADFTQFGEQIASKNWCTGASVEWMVLEADKYAGRSGRDSVWVQDLQRAIDDWEMKLNWREVDRQTILAIKGSSVRLRPKNWATILACAQHRLDKDEPLERSIRN